MAKAFTEEERREIKEKILETALDLCHDKGKKSLSIQEITKRVGIAQGSFYNFWKDKESLIIELIMYRSRQKLSKMEKEFPNSLENPVQFLSHFIYHSSIDMMVKIQTQPIYQDTFQIFITRYKEDVHRIETLYEEFLKRLIRYWEINKVVKKVDYEGIINAFVGSFVLCTHSFQFHKQYFEEILETYIYNIVNKYIEI